jgi:hypothetical protein
MSWLGLMYKSKKIILHGMANTMINKKTPEFSDNSKNYHCGPKGWSYDFSIEEPGNSSFP